MIDSHYRMGNTINLSERCYPEFSQRRVLRDHLARYEFAKQFVHGKTVADIGSGEGYGSALLKEAGGALGVIAIDNDLSIVESAKQKYPGIQFLVGDATHTGLPDSSVDIVTCFEVWHHLDRHEDFISEMRRILKPDGLLVCSVPNKRVIYLNPFHQKMLTEFYRKDFDKKTISNYMNGNFYIEEWYGQRFVSPFLLNSFVRLVLFLLSHVHPSIAGRIKNAYKLANGPQVLPLQGENARILIALARPCSLPSSAH